MIPVRFTQHSNCISKHTTCGGPVPNMIGLGTLNKHIGSLQQTHLPVSLKNEDDKKMFLVPSSPSWSANLIKWIKGIAISLSALQYCPLIYIKQSSDMVHLGEFVLKLYGGRSCIMSTLSRRSDTIFWTDKENLKKQTFIALFCMSYIWTTYVIFFIYTENWAKRNNGF